MSSTSQENPPPASTVPDLFRKAVAALHQAGIRRRRANAARRAAVLRESARCLGNAFLAARGHEPSSDAARIELLAAHPAIDIENDRPLIELMGIEPESDWTKEHLRELDLLEEQYRRRMPRFRAALAGQLPRYGSLHGLVRRTAGRRWVQAATTALAAVTLAGAVAFQRADPAYVLQVNGQVFWKHDPAEPFNEDRSHFFDVRVDGDLHEYTITFDAPVQIAMLRLDPVDNANVTEIEIHRVRLMDGAGGEPLEYDDLAGWTCVNCRRPAAHEGGNRLNPENHDPYLIAPPVDPRRVDRIHIEMRAAARKTFWEWITRLDKGT